MTQEIHETKAIQVTDVTQAIHVTHVIHDSQETHDSRGATAGGVEEDGVDCGCRDKTGMKAGVKTGTCVCESSQFGEGKGMVYNRDGV